jgi:hypothetical protein
MFGAVGLIAGLGASVDAASNALYKDYGCATTTVGSGEDVITAALAGGDKLGVGAIAGATTVITYAAESVPGSGTVDPGQAVTTCVEYSPLSLTGFGNGGWMADVRLGE